MTLTVKLKQDFSHSDSQISLEMSSAKISLLLGHLLLGIRLSSIDKRLLTVPGCFIFTLGVYMIGPSRLLGFPNTPDAVVAGLVIFGLGKSAMQCYAVNEMIAAGVEAFPEEEEEVRRLSSLIYTSIGSIGAIVMRFTSAGLEDGLGFRESMDV